MIPFSGQRIVVTRSLDQAAEMEQRLAALGAVPILCPAIAFAPLTAPELPTSQSELARYDWLIFTSGNAVRFFAERLDDGVSLASLGRQVQIAAVGSATQSRLQADGVAADFVPDVFTGEQLVWGLGDVVGQRVLLPRAKLGRPEIVDLLTARGAMVDDVALYDTITAVATPQAVAQIRAGVAAITFTSPSSVRNFWQMAQPYALAPIIRQAIIACIGPSTAAAAEQLGLTVAVMPAHYTIDALLTALATHFTHHPTLDT